MEANSVNAMAYLNIIPSKSCMSSLLLKMPAEEDEEMVSQRAGIGDKVKDESIQQIMDDETEMRGDFSFR